MAPNHGITSQTTLILTLSPCRCHPSYTPFSVDASQREWISSPEPTDRQLNGLNSRLGSVLFGYDLGVISSVLTAPDFLRTTGLESDSAADANYIGFIVSAFLLG